MTDDIPVEVVDVYRRHARKWIRCPQCGASGDPDDARRGVAVTLGWESTLSFSCHNCGNQLDFAAAVDRAAAEKDIVESFNEEESG